MYTTKKLKSSTQSSSLIALPFLSTLVSAWRTWRLLAKVSLLEEDDKQVEVAGVHDQSGNQNRGRIGALALLARKVLNGPNRVQHDTGHHLQDLNHGDDNGPRGSGAQLGQKAVKVHDGVHGGIDHTEPETDGITVVTDTVPAEQQDSGMVIVVEEGNCCGDGDDGDDGE